jgi:hypothetical protein
MIPVFTHTSPARQVSLDGPGQTHKPFEQVPLFPPVWQSALLLQPQIPGV